MGGMSEMEEGTMKASLALVMLVVLTTAVFPQQQQQPEQQADMVGSWEVYPVSGLSRYSIKEHRNPEATTAAIGGQMQLNADGSLQVDLANLAFESWGVDEGFLQFTSEAGNSFYWPRRMGQNVYFLVRVDVTELNEDIIYLNSRPQENLIIIRR